MSQWQVYVAGNYEAREQLRLEFDAAVSAVGLAGRVRGPEWLYSQESTDPAHWAGREFVGLGEDEAAIAARDVAGIERVDALIVDTRDRSLRGGREVEYGIALALGIPTVRVGPARNVFHHLASFQCAGFVEALAWIKEHVQPRSR